MGAATGRAPGRAAELQQRAGFRSSPPCFQGTKLYSAPSTPCLEGTFLFDLNTLGVAGLHPSLIARAVLVLSKVQDAKLPVSGETLGLKPACKSHGICLLLLAFWVYAGTQLLFRCALILCHHLVAHEMRHKHDGRMWIGFCLARLSPPQIC